MLITIVKAVALFIATNIDDVIILALFFVRGARQPNATRTIALGQYAGFIAILGAALLATAGTAALLPAWAIPYLGLIPLLLGIKAGWEAIRGEDDDELAEGKRVTLATVAAVTFANGGDNIGVYVPVFVTSTPAQVAVYIAVFLVLVAALVWIAKVAANAPGIREILEKSDRFLFPLVLILLGAMILVSGGAFGLGGN